MCGLLAHTQLAASGSFSTSRMQDSIWIARGRREGTMRASFNFGHRCHRIFICTPPHAYLLPADCRTVEVPVTVSLPCAHRGSPVALSPHMPALQGVFYHTGFARTAGMSHVGGGAPTLGSKMLSTPVIMSKSPLSELLKQQRLHTKHVSSPCLLNSEMRNVLRLLRKQGVVPVHRKRSLQNPRLCEAA